MPELSCWTIYERPRDYPNCYVARRFALKEGEPNPTTEHLISHNLEALRGFMQRNGLALIPRSEGDDPVIVETWM